MDQKNERKERKILLVEDSGFFRRALADSLEKEGYKVCTATNGEEALHCVERESPDIIVMDMFMPKLNGMMTLRVLRTNQKTQSIPVVVLSAKQEMQDVRTAKNLGVTQYCSKTGMTLEHLVNVIDRSIALHNHASA